MDAERRLLDYLWNTALIERLRVAGNDGKVAVHVRDLFGPDDPLTADIDSALAAPAVTETDRARIERDARLQDALDALDLATLWLHRTSDLPHMPSHQAESWERKARSGRVALRAALAAPAVTKTGDRRAALDVGEVSIALQRSGALSKHLSYHDLARCFIAALTDGRTDLGAPDEHDRHKAAPAVTETGDPAHVHEWTDAPDDEEKWCCAGCGLIECGFCPHAGQDIDAYLASPEAVEQVARALTNVQGGRLASWQGRVPVILTALRKIRADD